MAETTNVAIQQRSSDQTTDRDIKAIRDDIAAKRESISDTVDKLGDRIQATFNWREYVSEYPIITLGLAAGAGFLIAGIFKRKPDPRERIFEAFSELTEDMADRLSDVMDGVVEKRPMTGAFKAALSFAATKAISSFVKEQFAGNGGDLSRDDSVKRRLDQSSAPN